MNVLMVAVAIVTPHHTHTHTEDSSRRGIGLPQGPILDNTQHSQETVIYAPAGIEPEIPAS